ncbi:hypothetical protein VCR3J2_420202 [Vibrio coralliirubri]|nr:hypothetical protein VCR12J2_1020175 [Vibrio coralliirubri]CDT97061.1 hypothetical protein VCR3J2_420202 [Vibrio coralliirubri]
MSTLPRDTTRDSQRTAFEEWVTFKLTWPNTVTLIEISISELESTTSKIDDVSLWKSLKFMVAIYKISPILKLRNSKF